MKQAFEKRWMISSIMLNLPINWNDPRHRKGGRDRNRHCVLA
jgi:hypothetical protein